MKIIEGLSDDDVNKIVYALNELANRRQEQALDYRYNTVAKHANQDEARALRRLVEQIKSQWR